MRTHAAILTDDYRWHTTRITLRGHDFAIVSKPGLPYFGQIDPAAALLAETAVVNRADRVLVLHSGEGLVGAVAAGQAEEGYVWLSDPYLVAVEATRRTLEANGIDNATVYHSHGTGQLQLTTAVDVVLARLPKGTRPARQTIWDAWQSLRPGGRFYLAGANAEGIQSHLRHTGDLFGQVATLDYRRGCRVGLAVKGPTPACLPPAWQSPWLDHSRFHPFEVTVRGRTYAVCSRPGVFSWDRLDRGTELLIEAMEIGPADTVLDLGCGYGIVGLVAAGLAMSGQVYLVDADIEALESARRTLALHGLAHCYVLASDCAAAVRDVPFDVVATNPPFHQGRAATYDVARQFIRDAAQVLRPGGRFYLVANRFIPYEDTLRRTFGQVQALYLDSRYKVLRATRSPSL